MLKSTDGGANWNYLATGGKGSLWSGVAMPDGRIVVGGLPGSLFQSSDGGANWQPLKAETKSNKRPGTKHKVPSPHDRADSATKKKRKTPLKVDFRPSYGS